MSRPKRAPQPVSAGPKLHPRNRHAGRYDFAALTQASPELTSHLIDNPRGDRSIDFADPLAVKALNRALLRRFYGVEGWDIPSGYLCPPIPGRADYIHSLQDLLEEEVGSAQVRVLDVGTGANLVYPLIGHAEYGWHFVGSDIDADALASAIRILAANPRAASAIELRTQTDARRIFAGIIRPGERFDAVICNPPFHASMAAARAGSERKWRNLERGDSDRTPVLNFGGRELELWCDGGEVGFIRRMIHESAQFKGQVGWFTTLVSQDDHLAEIYDTLERAGLRHVRQMDLSQGQKKSRIVAWSYS